MQNFDRYEALEDLIEAAHACPEKDFGEFYVEAFKQLEKARIEKGFEWKKGRVVRVRLVFCPDCGVSATAWEDGDHEEFVHKPECQVVQKVLYEAAHDL